MLTKLSDEMKNDIWDRFWVKVNIGEPDECWEWIAGKDRDGYGRFEINKFNVMAHRVAFLLYGGKITFAKPHTLHTCSNPSCVNPNHLYAGDPQDNANDRIAAGHNFFKSGSNSPSAKLTNKDIHEIRRKWATGQYKQKILALHFNISQACISEIVNNKSYKKVSMI